MAIIDQLLQEVARRTVKGSKDYYKPFNRPESQILRAWYKEQVDRLGLDPNLPLVTKSDTVIAIGFTRIVVGDYGAYIEFSPEQVVTGAIYSIMGRQPPRPVKYIWMTAKDQSRIKIYFQQGTVKYADYQVGMYYVSPNDVVQ